LWGDEATKATLPHFPAKAKNIIYLHMVGGPSQMDLYDYKPVMSEWYDKDLPESIRRAEYSSPKVLIVQGHPRSDSFCAALAAAYRDGLGDRGVACELIAPADMNFDREVTHKGQDTRHDPGIERAGQVVALPQRSARQARLSFAQAGPAVFDNLSQTTIAQKRSKKLRRW